jgi:hypothetical protein
MRGGGEGGREEDRDSGVYLLRTKTVIKKQRVKGRDGREKAETL